MHLNRNRYLMSQDFYQFRTPQGKLRILLVEFVSVWQETWRLFMLSSNPCQSHYVAASNMETYDPSLFVNLKYLLVWENVNEVNNFPICDVKRLSTLVPPDSFTLLVTILTNNSDIFIYQ